VPEDGFWTKQGRLFKDTWYIDSNNSRDIYDAFESYGNMAIEKELTCAYWDVFSERLKGKGGSNVIEGVRNYDLSSALSDDFLEKSRTAILEMSAEKELSMRINIFDLASKHKQHSSSDKDISILTSACSFEEPEKRFLVVHLPVKLGLVSQSSPGPKEAPAPHTSVSRRLSIS
jgi:hypothetical protein